MSSLAVNEQKAGRLSCVWPTARLGDVCVRITDGTHQPPPFVEDGVPFLFVRNIVGGEIDFDTERFVSDVTFRELTKSWRASPGDVLYSAVGSYGVAVPVEADRPFVFQRHIALIRPRSDVLEPHFAAHFLNSPEGRRMSDERALGGAQKTVTLRSLADFRVPLPPLSEQKRIAASLREQLDAAARMRAAAEHQLAVMQRLEQAAIDCAFGALGGDRPMRSIGDFARVFSGYAFKSAWFSERGIRLVRNANVSQGRIDWADSARLPDQMRAEFAEFELVAGDIVLSLDRPVVAGGLKVARLSETDVPSLLLQRVATFRLKEGLDVAYLYAFLRSSSFLSAISGHEQSLGVPHISPRQVAAVCLPVPPMAKQRDVVRALHSELDLAAGAGRAIYGQTLAIGRLRAALLRSAFPGGSGWQD